MAGWVRSVRLVDNGLGPYAVARLPLTRGAGYLDTFFRAHLIKGTEEWGAQWLRIAVTGRYPSPSLQSQEAWHCAVLWL